MRNDPEPLDLVTVIESTDATLLTLMKALLDEAEIPYLARGEALQNLFGLGQLGTGFNPLIGAVRIEVRRDQADAARTLLSDFIDQADAPGE